MTALVRTGHRRDRIDSSIMVSAVKHTPSFVTMLLSLILAAVELMSRMVEHARNEARRGDNIALKIVVEILACLWRLVEVYVNFLTKMATTRTLTVSVMLVPHARTSTKTVSARQTTVMTLSWHESMP